MSLMKEVDLVIGSVQLQAEHPELFHYTTKIGFEKIVCSNTLWATYFKDLTDTDEIRVLKVPLIAELKALFDALVARRNRHIRRLYKATGGGKVQAAKFVTALYQATFETKKSFTAVDAFTTSFSTHSGDTDFERENGLQSQWDEYAKDGFCIALDTAEMCKILGQEFDTHYRTHLNLDFIRYAVDGIPLRDHFPELMKAASDSFDQFLNDVPFPEMAVPEFLAGATLLKGACFQKEREVRIAAVPGTERFRDQAKREHKHYPDKPLPIIRPRPHGTGRRYIAIFEGVGITLPIKRVIVGPSVNQAANAELARGLVGADRVVLARLNLE